MILYSALYQGGFPFEDLFDRTIAISRPEQLDPANSALIIWGGEDISPSIYGERVNNMTHAKDTPSKRDRAEVALAQDAIEMGVPIIGICRGAQLMCALSGGKVIQHTTGHLGSHEMLAAGGEVIVTSSLHHQMLYPWEVEHQLLAYTPQLSRCHWGEDDQEWAFPPHAYDTQGVLKEPEVVWFPKTRCLAIQGHPEFGTLKDRFVQYCRDLVKERITLAAA